MNAAEMKDEAPLKLHPADFRVKVSCLLLGTCAWLLTTAIFSQGPVLVSRAPEGSQIFTRLDLATEASNIVPAAVVLLVAMDRLRLRPGALSLALQCLSVAGAVLLAAKWDEVVGTHSVYLILGAVVSGVVGSCSMVCIFAFAAKHFEAAAVKYLSVGVGVSGIVTTLLAGVQGLAQGGGGSSGCGGRNASTSDGCAHDDRGGGVPTTRFSTSAFFVVVAVLNCSGVCACVYLIARSRVKQSAEAADAAPLLLLSEEFSGAAALPSVAGLATPLLPELAAQRRKLHCNIWVTSATVFGVVGLLPYLVSDGDCGWALFLLNAAFYVGSLLGRLATDVVGSVPLRRCGWLNLLQLACFVVLLATAAASMRACEVAPVPSAVSVLAVFVLTFCQGHIFTVVLAEAARMGTSGSQGLVGRDESAGEGADGGRCCGSLKPPPGSLSDASLVGLTNQAGALFGSLLNFVLVAGGVLAKG